eukprot:CAMPEP_0117520630 /NCGR_PEP_ID=MMETSP0784-20121206/33266_1 /TAXON_ID=39447 /ORGANISM="" /LENGTH=298 /DNA_ID=CAMNT_0005316627 /DNA_START=111 /DNA_END=1003 /DNA_ORIENTATION=+
MSPASAWIASLVDTVVDTARQSVMPADVSLVQQAPNDKDVDDDGIPDNRDSCPWQCLSQNGTICSRFGWRSGKATDFDSDGCQDGVEDLDRDNDGVRDFNDQCPVTPMHYTFVSSPETDFDGDGCADFVEDLDNDNDGVSDVDDRCPFTPMRYMFVSSPKTDLNGDGCADGFEDPDNDGDAAANHLDDCPQTRVDSMPDGSGCSLDQRPSAEDSEDPKWWEVAGSSCKATASPTSETQDDTPWGMSWLFEIRGASVEVIVGALLAGALTQLNRVTTNLAGQLPDTPSGEVGRRVLSVV